MSLPEVCPGCGTEHPGDNRRKQLAWAAHAAALRLGGVPARAVAEGPPVVRVTWFLRGRTQASGGVPWTGSLGTFTRGLRKAAHRVAAKGEGVFYTDAITDGWRRDTDTESSVLSVASRTLDSDGVPGGGWGQLEHAARAAGLALILSESSSHTEDAPSWHGFVPFSEPLVFATVAAWRDADAWLVGYSSALAGFSGVGRDYGTELGRHAPACGLDLRSKQSNRATPVFLAHRRAPEAEPARVVQVDGGALDLLAFLTATGYPEALDAWRELEQERHREPVARAAGPAGEPDARLEDLALAEDLKEWARVYAPEFAACGDRNAAALAVGGYLGGLGVSPRLASELIRALALAGGVDDPAGRARAARYSADNASRGGITFGWGTVSRLLGEDAALDLEDLAHELVEDE